MITCFPEIHNMNYLLSIVFILCSVLSFSQKGPGGVSFEFAGNSNCKMWCDAGTLALGDGATVPEWPDISLSVNVNTPTQTTVASQPLYRSAISESINGKPVLRFLPAQFLQLLTSDDINAAGPYTERTTFLAFRTGTDITARQMLWEQGGGVRGLNVYIFDGYLYFGGYDVATDGDGTPAWAYTYTRVPIEPSTAYVVTHIFDGPLGSTTGNISGFLNGQTFQLLNPGVGEGDPATNVGSLFTHPNAPGLGAVNGDSYNELGPISGATGSQPFLGDMAEFIAYSEILNDAERVIVENYLGAKYFADLVVNDFYDWQVNHGDEVIGLGRFTGSSNTHNVSQARNIFQIDAPRAEFGNADMEFFLMGHDNGDINTWTVTDAPNLGINTQRVAREWRADHTGDCGDIRFTIDAAELPAFPVGYSKLCLALDKSGGAISNFNSLDNEVIEMVHLGGGIYETTETIPDGTFVTFAMVRPSVQFSNTNDFGFENTPVGVDNAASVQVELNFRPIADNFINYSFSNISAIHGAGPPPGVDYFNVEPASGLLTIPTGDYTSLIEFDILGDSDPEATEDLQFVLALGAGSTPDLIIGANITNRFTIFDDDNTPKVGFSVVSSARPEDAGSVDVQIVRSGNTFPAVSVSYRLRIPGGNGTATNGTDYSYVDGVANFPSGVSTFDMPVTILEDLLDEPDETIIFELYNSIDCDIIAAQKEHTLTISDNDSPPEVCFVVSTQQGPETLGNPSLEVRLSAPSTLVCQIDYENLLTGTASLPADYTIGTTGTIIFAPGDTLETLPLFIINDIADESDETIDFAIIPGSAVNCTPGACLDLTYTIKDYSSFEWLGVAGVGMEVDNIFWLNAEELTNADGSNVSDFTDLSPNGQVINQGTTSSQPNMNFAGPNGKKELDFNGTSDVLDIGDDALINTSSFYQQKYITMAFSTSGDISSRQIVYEQGGGTRGISMYIDGGEFYFHIWSNADDNGTNSRWGVGSATGAFFVNAPVTANEDYVVSFTYQTDGGTGGTLQGFINGTSAGSIPLNTVSNTHEPRLYAHGDNGGLGGTIGSTRFHDNTSSFSPFSGAIQEVIHYSDAPYNFSRRIIVENYMAVKYDVPLGAGAQKYSSSYAAGYEHEIAGIGQFSSDDNHSDSKGTGMVRINNPNDLDVGDFLMWGHDNAPLDIGLSPYVEFIPGLANRLHRVWKASELGGDVGTVTIMWDLTELLGFALFEESDLVLLIDSDDGNFSNATIIESGRTYVAPAGELTFTGVNLNNDVWFTIGSKSNIGAPLPIELVDFEATIVNNQVRLDWTTKSELNNDFFTIERSRNGQVFTEVKKVNGAGNSSVSIDYTTWDERPLPNVSYYRLKQTDFDGSTSYSEVKSVHFDETDVLLYPNPGKEVINLRINTKDAAKIFVFDSRGRLINLDLNKQDNLYQINTSSLDAGMYFAKVVLNNEIIVREFVIR